MATMQTPQTPALGEHGEPCGECGAPLAADQRYCLNCGTRRTEPRVQFADYLNGNGADGGAGRPTAAPPSAGGGRDWTPIIALGGLTALGIMLAIGVLIGKGGNDSTATTPAPIVQVGNAGAAPAATSNGQSVPTSNSGFTSDWPAGKTGYTIEIGTLPKQGTTPDQVAAAKDDATTKGAPDVGALDTDNFASLPAGNYVIYSGVFSTKADATKALKPIQSKFPDAQVVQVSTTKSSGGGGGSSSGGSSGGSLTSGNQQGTPSAPVQASPADVQALDNASGANYEKQSQKLPDVIATQGKPPPTDNKDPGAGSGSVVIK